MDYARTMAPESALVVADSARRMGARWAVVDQIVTESRGKRGIRTAREVLARVDGRSQSPGESLVRFASWRAGLPEPSLQVPVRTAAGRFVVDLAWEEIRVGVEFDGQVKYSGAYGDPTSALLAEKRRHDALVEVGWWIVRVTWGELGDMEALGAKLRRARAARR